MPTGTYKDTDNRRPHLDGKTALLQNAFTADVWFAQFDDRTLKEAYGWHALPAANFVVDPIAEDDGS